MTEYVVYISNDYEWTSSGVTQYYTTGSQRVGMRRSGYAANNGLFWLMGDHLGSTSITASANGSFFSEQRYTAWGTNRYTSGSLLSQRQYTGQINDGFGLYFYNARFYDPLLARFSQADTLVPNPANPSAFDRYAYSINNPIVYRDPSGHWIESAIDIAFIIYDIYDISQNGLNWETGLSLAADVAGLALPGVTGGGMMVRAATKTDDVVDAVKATNRIVTLSDEAIAFGKRLIENLAEETHHLASNLHKTKWTPIFESVTKKYGNLNDLWNKIDIPHKSKHPTAYHEWVAKALRQIDQIAQGDPQKFRELFKKYVADVVEENPWLLKKDWWDQFSDEFWDWWKSVIEQGL